MEAAKVDGANLWQRLKSIVFPLLMPSFTICLFLTLSGAFKIYDVNLSLTKGGPSNATEMFAMNIFNEIFAYGNYGLGQAKAIIFFLIVAGLTLTQVIITKRREVQM
jgi:raffinose/stachyose/melibiose transport system permease protein